VLLPTPFPSQDDAKEKSRDKETKKQRNKESNVSTRPELNPKPPATQFTLLTHPTKSTMYEFDASSIGIDHSQQTELACPRHACLEC